MGDTPGSRARIAALRKSHDRLDSLVDGLEPGQLTGPSYCSDWTIAQVLSHLGSGAEIFSLFVEAGVTGAEPPGRDMFPSIWDSWNAKDPATQAADFRGADRALVEQLESLDDEQLDGFQISLFGMDLNAQRLVGMRLSEHTLHSWDIAVALDDQARLLPDAVEFLIDTFPERGAQAARPSGTPLSVRIETTEPKRSFLLSVDESATIEENPAPAETDDKAGSATLTIPSEALIRLVAGRLDSEHTPEELSEDAAILDELRKIFPGF
jgi:uncharacterized protein (TIGR03083 family)